MRLRALPRRGKRARPKRPRRRGGGGWAGVAVTSVTSTTDPESSTSPTDGWVASGDVGNAPSPRPHNDRFREAAQPGDRRRGRRRRGCCVVRAREIEMVVRDIAAELRTPSTLAEPQRARRPVGVAGPHPHGREIALMPRAGNRPVRTNGTGAGAKPGSGFVVPHGPRHRGSRSADQRVHHATAAPPPGRMTVTALFVPLCKGARHGPSHARRRTQAQHRGARW